MVPFRLLVRFKIFQLAGVAALAVPINTFLSEVRRTLDPKPQALDPDRRGRDTAAVLAAWFGLG